MHKLSQIDCRNSMDQRSKAALRKLRRHSLFCLYRVNSSLMMVCNTPHRNVRWPDQRKHCPNGGGSSDHPMRTPDLGKLWRSNQDLTFQDLQHSNLGQKQGSRIWTQHSRWDRRLRFVHEMLLEFPHARHPRREQQAGRLELPRTMERYA